MVALGKIVSDFSSQPRPALLISIQNRVCERMSCEKSKNICKYPPQIFMLYVLRYFEKKNPEILDWIFVKKKIISKFPIFQPISLFRVVLTTSTMTAPKLVLYLFNFKILVETWRDNLKFGTIVEMSFCRLFFVRYITMIDFV